MNQKRYEFSKETKREALKRSEGYCEAKGKRYGLAFNVRCNAKLSYGVEFDHYPLPAYEKDSNVVENCMPVCKSCHKFATCNEDIPRASKEKRVSDKHLGIKRVKQKIQSRGFQSYLSNTKQLQDDRL